MRQHMQDCLIISPEATGGIRTPDLLITNQLLYQLSTVALSLISIQYISISIPSTVKKTALHQSFLYDARESISMRLYRRIKYGNEVSS